MNSRTMRAARPGLRAALPLLCVMASLYGCGGGNTPGTGADGASNSSNTAPPASASPAPGTPAAPTAPGTPTDTASGSPLAPALASGNAGNLTLATVMSAAQTLLSTQIAAYGSVKQAIFNGVSAIDWNPSHDSAYFTLQDAARNHVILPGNWKYKGGKAGSGVALGIAGTAPNSATRYAAFGGNPLGVPGNSAMDKLMGNTIAWLSGSAGAAGFKVVVSQLPGAETYWFPHETKVRDWFYARYPGVTVNGAAAASPPADNSCDGAALAGCLQGANLLVIGSEQGPGAYAGDTVMQAVADAQARGIPVLYLNHNRNANDLAARLSAYFGLGHHSNYWNQEGLQAFDPATLPAQPALLAGIQDMLTRLDKGTFSTAWSGCGTSSPIDCSSDASYMAEFGTQAAQIRTTLRQFDASGTPLFAQPGNQLEKLLVLLGDKYRENVSYPMDKTANKQDFFRAYFSDVTAFIHRGSSAVARNLGNFAPTIPASTPAIAQTVTVTLPASGTREYLTGLYVIPGRQVTLTRTDGGAGAVRFGLNMLRDTTREFNTYDRPTMISSPRTALAANKPQAIASPYGGPLMLFVDAAASGSQEVTVQVDGVIPHPVLRKPNDPAAVSAFQSEVGSTVTNWVGFATDTLTLHSTLDHFKQTMASYSGNMAALAADTFKYTVKDTYELAGFNSSSGQLVLPASVTGFCNSKGWDCTGPQHRRDTMQHVISDVYALCGAGCSGNPYDQNWAFQPLGWGESHEIGHGLQVARLKIYDGQSVEVSNNLFPMHKQMQYNLSPAGIAAPIAARPNTGFAAFSALKAALGSADPVTAMYNSTWSDTSYAANNSVRVMFYRQLSEYARHYNSQFQDGWEVHTLLYLLDRNFAQAASTWATQAASFGFGTYASYPGSISGNDFMLVASSYIIGRDMGPMFALWGITTSAAAKAQVAAYGYPAVQQLYFPMNDLAATPARVGQPVAMSATASYPAGY